MSDRINQNAGVQGRFQADVAGNDPANSAVGSWRGETVRVEAPDLLSLLDDAKEELTFSHAEHMEAKEIAEREVEEPETHEDHVDRAEAASAYLDHLPDFDPGEFERLLHELRHGHADPEHMLERARGHFPDASHADAALELVSGALRKEGRNALGDAATTARALLQERMGPAVRAGYNVTAAALEAAQGDWAAAQKLRDGYRETVFANPGAPAVYRGILVRLKAPDAHPPDIQGQMRFLIRALGDDLASAGPSMPKTHLQEIVGDLNALHALGTAHDRCGQLTDRIRRQSRVELQVHAVMEALLPFAEQPISGSGQIMTAMSKLGIPGQRFDTQVLFLREARDVLATMPVAVFRDTDARFAVLHAMQDAMDKVIEREEAE